MRYSTPTPNVTLPAPADTNTPWTPKPSINDYSAMGGGLGAALAQLFGGGGKDPMSAANQYFNKIPGQMGQYMNPYIKAGQGALGNLQGQYGNLINDPGGLMAKLGGGFQASPGYKYQVGQAQNAINNAAAAGGMLGTPQEQQEMAQTVGGLANQDYYNYLNHVLGMYGQGLQGMEGINQQGYGASTNMANNLANLLQSQGNMAYANQQNRNMQQGGVWGALGGAAGALAPYLLM